MKSYADVESKVLQWGMDRGIVQHGSPMGQAIKTLEETTELLDAINKAHPADVMDALGDIWVTMVMCAATMNLNLMDCFYQAFEEIKDRKGFLTAEGVFVKEVPHAN